MNRKMDGAPLETPVTCEGPARGLSPRRRQKAGCQLCNHRLANLLVISDCVPNRIRMHASPGFVSASALGMACGPALSELLRTNFKICKITFNGNTLPGWPAPLPEVKAVPQEDDAGLLQPLHLSSKEKDENEDGDGSDETSEELHVAATSIGSAYKLLTPFVKVRISFQVTFELTRLLITVAVFLACLGLTVLPVNIIIGSYIRNMFEDRKILLTSEIMVCIGIFLSFHVTHTYSVPQYVILALITFVSAEVLEGVNLSLLSRMMSSRLARGTYNGVLLSTEAGTLARVMADATVTLAGYVGQKHLLNIMLLPSLMICVVSIMATCFTCNTLY
ncbi:hypothetical protein C5167_027737 [Papaver somniferum]|nr:hypothetical protein C5167_027737 [Papaver somniferum]